MVELRDEEYNRVRHQVVESLPNEIRNLRHQWLGYVSSGCAATHGVHEACDFSCTACYLSSNANQSPPLPFEEVRAQLDLIRREGGPGGKAQITAGEVTLLPVEELTRIVKYAKDIGLDPMLMTHGQTFDRDPGYLEHLMREGGLQKIAVHVDTTQRGRDGHGKHSSEQDLMSVRDRFANQIREMREKTGLPLHAAHTMTVTNDNLDDLPEIMQWFGRNADAFRLLSLQPTADVGRTRVKDLRTGEQVWDKLCEGADVRLNPHTFYMGHPDCNMICLMFVVRFGDEVRFVEVKTESREIDARFFDQLFSGDSFRGFHIDGGSKREILTRVVQLFARAPRYLWQWPIYSAYRMSAERSWLARFFKAVATGKKWSIIPSIIIVHNFMSSDQLDTEVGRLRLDACSFKVPVNGKMVSMCEVNGTDLRHDLNSNTQKRLVPIRKKRKAS